MKVGLVGMLFAASYLLALLAGVPSGVVTTVLEQRVAGLETRHPHGDLLRGGVGNAAYLGFPLGALQWSIRPRELARGCIGIALSAPQGGRLLTCLDGRTRLDRLRVVTDGDRLAGWPPLAAVNVFGDFELEIERALWRNNDFRELDGRLLWRQAAVAVFDSLALGTVEMTLTARAGEVQGIFHNSSAEVSVNGEFRLDAHGVYALDATLFSENKKIRSGLSSLGLPASASGGYRLQFFGSLTFNG